MIVLVLKNKSITVFNLGGNMKCKHCKKDVEIPLVGLRSFCSRDCRKAHRLAYRADWMKKKRCVNKRNGYKDTDSRNVNNTNPCQKPICQGQNDGLRLPEDNFERFGGKQWYDLAKKECCNFEVKEREDYCITLSEPYQSYKAKCSECELMHHLLADFKRKNIIPRHFRKAA